MFLSLKVSSVHSSQYCSEPDDFIPQLTNALTDDDQYVFNDFAARYLAEFV